MYIERGLRYNRIQRLRLMISCSIAVLLEAWQEHQLTNRELVTEARQLTPEDRGTLRVAVQQTIATQQPAAATS
jgi:hypothetical protein